MDLWHLYSQFLSHKKSKNILTTFFTVIFFLTQAYSNLLFVDSDIEPEWNGDQMLVSQTFEEAFDKVESQKLEKKREFKKSKAFGNFFTSGGELIRKTLKGTGDLLGKGIASSIRKKIT